MIKVLWVCNLILPRFSEEYGVRKQSFGGWMSGMLAEIEKYSDIDIALCFPIRNEALLKKGEFQNHKYYSLHTANDVGEYSDSTVNDFIEILNEYSPDIVHIWGTEYNHSRVAIEACQRIGVINKVLIDIQGLVSVYALHYFTGIDVDYLDCENERGESIRKEQQQFERLGRNEIFDISHVSWVSGRTDWDNICALQINNNLKYFKCHRILRQEFYDCKEKWSIENIERHTIFVSQGTYSIKGLHFLIKAIPYIKKEYSDVKVIVAGVSPLQDDNGIVSPYGKYIKELIGELGIEDSIEFIGTITGNEMVNLFLKSHVSVSPSNVENPSNSICEAMYLGTPIIASYVGGCNEIIQHGYDGLMYPNDAHYMLAGYVCKIFRDDSLAVKLSTNAIVTAEKRHDKKALGMTMYTNYQTIYKES